MKRKTVFLICGLFFFSPSGSLSCSFTTHQTLLCLLDTGAPDQSCIVVFSPGRHLQEVVLKTGAFGPLITHRWFSLSLQPSCPLVCGIITKQRSFYVGDSEAALLVSFYLSATALSLSPTFPWGAPGSSETCGGLLALHCWFHSRGVDAYSAQTHTHTLDRALLGSRGEI